MRILFSISQVLTHAAQGILLIRFWNDKVAAAYTELLNTLTRRRSTLNG